jgi:gas vesicle protein
MDTKSIRFRRKHMDTDGLANFFLGLGVGVGIGLLFAPKSGEETRGVLKTKADGGKEYLKKQAADLRENASGMASEIVDKSRDVISRQKDTLNDAIQAGRPIGKRWSRTDTGSRSDHRGLIAQCRKKLFVG